VKVTIARRLSILLCAAGLLAPARPALAAGTLAEQCAAAKQRAAGKKLAGKLTCHAKAKAAAAAVEPACLDKAEARFTAGFTKAGGACPGDPTGTESAVDNCIAQLLALAPGAGKCPSASTRAVGKTARSELGCTAKEITRPGTESACVARGEAKLGAALGMAGGCVGAGAASTAIAACRDDIAGGLPPATSTTTSTSATTSSTAAPSCLDGIENGAETDIDCGGGTCPGCRYGKTCGVGTDCLSASCTASACAALPACTDGMKDGNETDVDCGGGACPLCPNGKSCFAGFDCVSGHCNDGTCEP